MKEEPKFYGAIRVPTDATLAKYGMTYEGWSTLLRRQGFACAICKQIPSTGMLRIDHAHVKGWKKLPPEEKRKHVRGLLCYFDNKFTLARQGNQSWRLRAAADYLDAHAGDDHATHQVPPTRT
jgi:hypothetical protein